MAVFKYSWGAELQGGQLTDADLAWQYLFERRVITITSERWERRFSYRLREQDGGHAVEMLNGPDNRRDFRFIGRIGDDGQFASTTATPDVRWLGFKLFAEAVAALWAGDMPAGLGLWHDNVCGRCRRRLTVPTSVAFGFGPECIDQVKRRKP